VILISHDHEVTVTKSVGRLVLLVVLEAENLLDVLDLDVLQNLVVARLTNVEKLSTQREDTKLVTGRNGTDTGDGESLGGVTFGEDEGAARSLTTTSPVGVLELGDTTNTSALGTVSLLELLVLLEASDRKDVVDNARLGDCLLAEL
jgi:hypothetical protein